MPLYEYKCDGCGEVFEKIEKFSAEALTVHEKCGGPVHRLISAPAFQFKGSGWYVTDYAKSGSGKDPSSKESSSKESSSSGDNSNTKDGAAASSSDSSSSSKPAAPSTPAPAAASSSTSSSDKK